MADPVKISELPAISSVQANDLLPVVDAALTQTSKCTAGQIARIGGGPPGDGLVVTASLANGAVTAPKTGFTGPDKLSSRILAGAGEGVEIPCTGYARGLLATANSAGALAYLGGLQSSTDPTFSGTMTVNGTVAATGQVSSGSKFLAPVGSAASPSFTITGDTNTGLAQLGGADTLSVVTGGVERLRVAATGALSATIPGGSSLLPFGGCRAWVNFAAGGTVRGSFNISSIVRTSQGNHTINFTTAMPDENYAVVSSGNALVNYTRDGWVSSPRSFATTNFVLVTTDNNNDGNWDFPLNCVAVFR